MRIKVQGKTLQHITIITMHLLLVFFAIPCKSTAQQKGEEFPALIPLPLEVSNTYAVFNIDASTAIICGNDSLHTSVELLNNYISGIINKNLPVKSAASNFISIGIDTFQSIYEEGYRLVIDNDHISVTAHDTRGVIHGIQTLRQLWQSSGKHSLTLPGCIINDHPRFGYRGMHLDVSRHMFDIPYVKKMIDLLALYKFNTFHWHLTDDQGWRIEIKKYPRLQSVSAWRNETLTGHKKEAPHVFDGKRYGGYYTQAEIKEIVKYAQARGITIIPEIEMPGHSLAALAAYPTLGCTGGPYSTAGSWGVFNDVFCAGNDSVFTFMQDVLDEVIQLFPSKYIHIGGDECPKTRWMACPRCQKRIKDLSLSNEHELQNYFIRRIEKYLNGHGRDIIGWDEILEGGLAPNATVMSWRGEEGGILAAKQKHNVVMTPESNLYLDYYQSLYAAEPIAAGGYTPLDKVYNYEPAPASLPDSISRYITGLQAQAWSEYFTTGKQAEYMLFPRLLAVAETGWTPASMRNYDQFLGRLRKQEELLDTLHVNYARVFDEISYIVSQPGKKMIELSLSCRLPGKVIRYTTDGSTPSAKSSIYTTPLAISRTGIIKAICYNSKGRTSGRVFSLPVRIHKATGASIALSYPPSEKYNPGSSSLVNGLFGNDRYNNGHWLGLSGNDLEATIDLGKEEFIKNISLHFLHYPWQRMWAPVALTFYLSDNGKDFKEVYLNKDKAKNGINKVNAVIPNMKARYVKVKALNKGTIPENEYGAGSKALLMVDEIIID